MKLDFSDFIKATENSDFEEIPVDLKTFLYSKDYMNVPQLSPIQEEIIELGSQVYKKETLIDLYGEEEGLRKWNRTKLELYYIFGKGSGKDFCSALTAAYLVYKLLCLKDPALYFGRPKDDYIDIINVGINARHAREVYFTQLSTRIKNCKWFKGKYSAKVTSIEFIKDIRIHSLNSESSASDGYNCLVCVFDEADEFDDGNGTEKADGMFKVLSANVSSRFSGIGKVIVISYPRTKNGFMYQKYNDVVVEKTIIKKSHTFKLNPELPDGLADNEFTIHWDEDEVHTYKYPGVFALKRPTWDVNPTKKIDDFVRDFYRDTVDALGRFACQPPEFGDGGWFRDKAKIDATFTEQNGVSLDGSIIINPEQKEYYIHVDLARTQDNMALAMSHVEDFRRIKIGNSLTDPAPYVRVDLVRYWTPGPERSLDFTEVREFIISLKRKGFNIVKVTFDRWESVNIIDQLNNLGIEAEKLSVDFIQYNELALAMGENRIKGPEEKLLINELKELIVLPNGKIDHPSKSSKDLADATAGSVYNAIANSDDIPEDTEVFDYSDMIEHVRKRDMPVNTVHIQRELPPELEFFIL